MGRDIPVSEDGTPYRFRVNAFATDYLDFSANQPNATEAEKELGAIGFVVLPELNKLLVQIRAVYTEMIVNGKPCYELCVAGLVLIYEHVVLLLAEALLAGKFKKGDKLNVHIKKLSDEGVIRPPEFDLLDRLRKLRNSAVHNDFKHSQVDMKERFLAMHRPLMEFLQGRFITGGSVASKLPFLDLRQGIYYIKPAFESDAFVQKFWLPRCVAAGTQPAPKSKS